MRGIGGRRVSRMEFSFSIVPMIVLTPSSYNTVHLTILIRLEMSMRRVRWRWRGRRL